MGRQTNLQWSFVRTGHPSTAAGATDIKAREIWTLADYITSEGKVIELLLHV
jgi:hypothetical protein